MTVAASASSPSPTTRARVPSSRGWFGRRMRPPRRLRITREGKVFIGVTLGVGFAAINTGNNLLYLVLGLLLSIIILSGVLSEIALRGLQFRRKLPRRAFAGTPMLVEIEVRNSKRYAPSYSIEVEDRIDRRRTDKRCYFLKVSAGARQTAAYRRTPPVRGTERYAALRVATRFPFGLFEKWREIELVEEQLVYPAPTRAARPPAPASQAGDALPREGAGRGEVDGVRELREGEPARDIDWKKTAVAHRIIARERRREGARLLRLEVHNQLPAPASNADATRDAARGPGAPSPRTGRAAKTAAPATPAAPAVDPIVAAAAQRLEDDLRRVAWIALDALRDGTAVELRAEDGGDGTPRAFRAMPSPGAADKVLAFLARLPPEARLPEPTPPPAPAPPTAAPPRNAGPPRAATNTATTTPVRASAVAAAATTIAPARGGAQP